METIKETDDEESDLHEAQTLINNKINSELAVKTLEDLARQPSFTRKSSFPRNFSTMSFMATKKRKPSRESLSSSYLGLDFTGSSIQLQLQVLILNTLINLIISGIFLWFTLSKTSLNWL